jgi:glycosyltransferase involved in cell wall biosynthesis
MSKVINSSNKKTIAIVFHFTPNSNRTIEQFLLKLSEKLCSNGFQLIHCYTGEPNKEYRQALSALDIVYFVSEPVKGIVDGVSLGNKLRRYSPDILFTGFYSAFNRGIWALKFYSKSKRWFLNDHSSGVTSEKTGLARVISKCRGNITGYMIDRIICVSNFVKIRDINQVYLPENKMVTIYNGIDTEKFSTNTNKNNDNDTSLVTIVYAGQLIQEKGVDTLLRAAAMLNIPYRLLIAGKGNYEAELKTLAQNLSVNVQWLGQINWIPKLFSEADIAVFPSSWAEAFGLVIVEAMSCGTCVVASNVGGIPEVVGDAGALFKANDEHELLIQLERLSFSSEERKKLSAAATERVARLFNINDMVEKYSDELSAPLINNK